VETCSACGARLKPELRWCWRCFAPVGHPDPGPGLPPGASQTDLDLDPSPRYSRWRSGPTTFGPVGRISITVAVAFFGWLVFTVFRFVDGPLVIADVGVYAVGTFFVLRHVWRRDRVA